MQYRYRLGKIRGICPQCGRRTFKYYVDSLSGEIVDQACGRCNRENSCRYHSKPSEYVGQPDFADRCRPPTEQLIADESFDTIAPHYARQCPGLWTRDNLYRYLWGLFGGSVALEAFSLCGVTHAKAFGGSAVFWLRDAEGALRSGKVMQYQPDGHRVKTDGAGSVSWVHSLLGLKGFNYKACFFGERLAAKAPLWSLVLVESEKTALMLTAATIARKVSGYVFLATGGCSGLNIESAMLGQRGYKGNILKERDVIVVPDADKIEEWRQKSMALHDICRSVSFVDVSLPPYSLSGSDDIGDYVERKRA